MRYKIWDKVNKKLRTDLIVNQEGKVCSPIAKETRYKNGEVKLEVYNSSLINQDNYEKLRFTGLEDKNGNEIYEGDKIKLHQFLFDGNEIENELIGIVVYDKFVASFSLTQIENSQVNQHLGYKDDYEAIENYIPISNFYGLHDESFEIIGKIYENPELLEVKE